MTCSGHRLERRPDFLGCGPPSEWQAAVGLSKLCSLTVVSTYISSHKYLVEVLKSVKWCILCVYIHSWAILSCSFLFSMGFL